MRDNTNFQELVNATFTKHGVDNKELENAIIDILKETLDSRTLARRVWKDVIEFYERDKKVKELFR